MCHVYTKKLQNLHSAEQQTGILSDITQIY